MKGKVFLFLIFLSYLLNATVFAFDEATYKELMRAKTLKCSFDKGSHVDWSAGAPKIRNSNYSKDKESSYTTFDSINLSSKKARGIGSQGAVDVDLVVTLTGITFIEFTQTGNLVFTTVFSTHEKDSNRFLAVESRHMDMVGQPVPSQYCGTCEALTNG